MTELPKRYTQSDCSKSGGFSDVIFCKDNHLDRKVAIKFIKDKYEKKRIFDEIRALLRMRSKHVVQVYDVVPGEHECIGIVEEFIEGEDLQVSDFPRQSLEKFLKTLWQIAAGIADIHAAEIIHRDIKPTNIKLDAEGIVKIFDFGLARKIGKDAKTKGFIGTTGFAAPELFNSSTVTFTQAIDIYAFGATAIFIACKDLPSEIKKDPPQSLKKDFFAHFTIKIPDPIAELLYKCLLHDPHQRPLMRNIRDQIGRYLLRDKHQALAVYNGGTFIINANKRSAGFNYPEVGEIEITYDGLKFFVSKSNGEVFINNAPVTLNQEIPGSCVVALGDISRQNSRVYVTFDVSNPEVVL